MANLENNNENENKKSLGRSLEDSVEKGVENVQKNIKNAKELAEDFIQKPGKTTKEYIEQTSKDVVSVKWWAKLLQVLFWSVLILIISFVIIVNLPMTKNWAAQKVMVKLNEDLKTKIYFDKIDVNYFGDVTIHQLFVKDYKNFPFLKAEELYADSDWFSIISNSRNLRFQSMSLKNMDLKVITYKGDSISNFIRFVDLFDDGKPSTHKTPFQLKSRIFVKDSKVSIVNENIEGEGRNWMNAENVNLIIPELRVKGPEVYAQINNLNFVTERWGKKHRVNTFTTNLTLNKKYLFLDDLTMDSGASLLQGDIKFNLHNGRWGDFSNKVKWEMSLIRGSQISGYDISYFKPNWDNYTPINVSGQMQGVLNDFTLTDFFIHTPQVNIRTKETKVKNILEDQFLISAQQLSTDFTYQNLRSIMPTFIAKKMKTFADPFGRIKYDGMAQVTPQQVYIPNANLITEIGQAKVKNFYLTEYSSDLPKYNGYLELQNFNTAAISKSKEVGLLSGNFTVKGQSFEVDKIRLETQSKIDRVEILGKDYHNIVLNGILDHRQYSGLVSINDPQAKAVVNGQIDFRIPRILMDIKANVDYLNIAYLTGQKTRQNFSGSVEGKIAMSNVNDMNLDVNLNQVKLSNGNQNYSIPNGKLKAFFENGNRIVSAEMPGAVTGKISGKFNLEDLAGMLQNGIEKILVSPAPKKIYKGQDFSMNFKIEQGLLHYFLPTVNIPKGANIDGVFTGSSNNLVLNMEAQKLFYLMDKKENKEESISESKISKDSIIVDQLSVHINTANKTEQIFAHADRAQMQKNIFKEITLSGTNPDGNLLHLATQFKYGSREDELQNQLKDYAINLNQSVNSSGDLVFKFEPTQIDYNGVLWAIDTDPTLDHSITYRKKTGDFLIKNLKIFSDESFVFVKNAQYQSGDTFKVDGEVKNFQVEKIFQVLNKENDNQITGIANGNFSIEKKGKILQPLINLKAENLKMNLEDLGNLTFTVTNSEIPNVFNVEGRLGTGNIIGNNKLQLSGTVDFNASSPKLNLATQLDDFDVAFAQQFVGSVFSKMRGKANGILNINGNFDNIDYNGDIALKGFGMKLGFTGVDYSFDDTTISIAKGLAFLNDIGVKDGRKNSKGSISGLIRFETLSSLAVDLVMRADNLLVLDTTQKDFDLFWGRVYGRGTVNISGPVSALNLESDPQNPFKALNNSTFTFNSSSNTSVDEFKMLRFLKRDTEGKIEVEEKKKTGANMNVDLIAAVDKGTTVNVLIGGELGNISVRGASDKLRFKMSRTGTIEMSGNYVVDNGTFISKAILERTFQITKGSSIQWDGNPMTPDLNITATYLRTVSNANKYLQMNNIPPMNIQLTTKITQKLNNPLIELGVEAPDASSQLKEALAEKMNNKDERTIQFGSILVLDSFNISSVGISGLNLGSTLESSGYSMLFKQLGSVLNALSDFYQLDLDYISGDPSSNTGDRAIANVSFSLSPRVKLKTGLGIPITHTENTTNQFLSGQGIMEYDWSKNNDGTRIFRVYSKPSNIGLIPGTGNTGANQSYGVGVVYSKSFNYLFNKKEKDKTQKSNSLHNKLDSIKQDSVK